MTRKTILDVDTGTDDAVSIMFAALHPDIDLLAVTTVHGNAPVASTTDNTLRVLDWIGASTVPVFGGLSRPIVRLDFPAARHFDTDSADDPHGTTLSIPPARTRARETGAVEYLLHTLRTTTEQLTLVATAPLSNIAAALAIDPSIVEAVEEIVIMGGGHTVANVTASAEFNTWADPEAAQMVFSAGFERLTLIPLDATYQALITRRTCTELEELGTPAGVAAARFIDRRITAYEGSLTTAGAAPVHDVLCPAYLVQPDLVTTRHLPVAVETAGSLSVGRTVMDTRPGTTQKRNAHVAFTTDAQALARLLLGVFAKDLESDPGRLNGAAPQ
ncbi:nucleoside hydrolase [Streptomyces hainanensis]|uniref:Nucleoside hydrolase n=1 Tax=Streptomyces hainanensis TaxID=402648 RepID=A0A4R4TDF5_9ACTN|nr:nucleoside hydrolase [Streptomyces hainanensis]TDC75578.1 nucleoside hydrolase [Streptomyces hainanensis]